MSTLLPELGSVRVHETERELVVEIEVPTELDASRLVARLEDGTLTITLPRVRRISGFHPDAEPV